MTCPKFLPCRFDCSISELSILWCVKKQNLYNGCPVTITKAWLCSIVNWSCIMQIIIVRWHVFCLQLEKQEMQKTPQFWIWSFSATRTLSRNRARSCEGLIHILIFNQSPCILKITTNSSVKKTANGPLVLWRREYNFLDGPTKDKNLLFSRKHSF